MSSEKSMLFDALATRSLQWLKLKRNFARKLVPVARRSKSIYTFLG